MPSAVTSLARIECVDPSALADAICTRYGEHDIEAERLDDHIRELTYRGVGVVLTEEARALGVELSAPTEDILISLREGFTRLVSGVAPEVVADLRWSGVGVEGLPPGFRELKLLGSRLVAPSLMRMTFSSVDLQAFTHTGLHVRLLVPQSAEREPVWPRLQANGMLLWPEGEDRLSVRVYTIRNVRVDLGELDVDVVVHAGGTFSDWAQEAKPGTRIGMTGPGGGFLPDADDWLLMGGDLTALPALCRILELLPSRARGHAVLTVPDRLEEPLFLSRPEGVGVTLVAEKDAENDLVATMKSISLPAEEKLHGWFGGEFDQAQDLRSYFKRQLKLPKDRQLSVAYWRRGQAQGGE